MNSSSLGILLERVRLQAGNLLSAKNRLLQSTHGQPIHSSTMRSVFLALRRIGFGCANVAGIACNCGLLSATLVPGRDNQ